MARGVRSAIGGLNIEYRDSEKVMNIMTTSRAQSFSEECDAIALAI